MSQVLNQGQGELIEAILPHVINIQTKMNSSDKSEVI